MKTHLRKLLALVSIAFACSPGGTAFLFAQEGAVDGSFQSPVFRALVSIITVENDGRVLYSVAEDGLHYAMGRLNTDGSAGPAINIGDGAESITPAIDVGTFHLPGSTNPATINVLRPLPNGQILVGGTFSHFNKVARKLLVRLNADGSVDSTFNAANGFTGDNVGTLALGAGGKIYVGGKFTKFGSSTRNVGLVRLNADGTLDTSFVDSTISFGANVTDFSLQPDGKPVIDAAYANSSFQATLQVYRLGANGGLDAGFAQGAGSTTAVGPQRHVVMADGQILVTGGGALYNGVAVNNALYRLKADGTVDTGFAGLTLGLSNIGGLIGRFLPQTNGTVYFSGAFDTVNGQNRHGLARLKADATLDPAFAPAVFVSPGPGALAVQSDGKILACSSVIVGVDVRYNIVRLNGGGTGPTPPNIGNFTLLPGGGLQMQVAGGATTVILESSTTLTTWQRVATNSVTGGVAAFTDLLGRLSSARFYRLLLTQ